MDNGTDYNNTSNPDRIEPWNYALVIFLLFNLVVSEWTNMSLLYSINRQKLDSVRAQLVKCMTICGALNSLLLIAPAGVAALGETGIVSRTGCLYHNLIMQTTSVANRLLMLLLAVEQFCYLVGKQGLRLSRSSLSTVLFVLFLLSVFVSSSTVLQQGRYVTRRNVFLCVLPSDWLTISFELTSYIVPCVCLICITTYSLYVTTVGRKYLTNINKNNDRPSSTDIRAAQLPPKVSKTVVSIARIVIPLSFLLLCSSFLRLIGVVLNYNSVFLIISLICDTITYTVEPLAFVYSSSVLKEDFEELMLISFSRTTTSVQVPSPSHRSVPPSIPSVSNSLATGTDTASESSSDGNAKKMDEGDNSSNGYKCLQISSATETEKSWKKFTMPKETDNQQNYEFSLGACGGNSSLVQFESTVGLYKYVSACNPTTVNVEISEIDDESPEENFKAPSPGNVHRHSFNESLRITHPYTQIDRNTSHRYSRNLSGNNRSHSLEMLHKKKQLMHMNGSVIHDSEQIMPSVDHLERMMPSVDHSEHLAPITVPSIEVNSIEKASSKQYRISTACPGLLRDSDTRPQQGSWTDTQNDYTRKESDTGELVVRKYCK